MDQQLPRVYAIRIRADADRGDYFAICLWLVAEEASGRTIRNHKAFDMAPKILAGIVTVNSPTVNDDIHAPMGGVRDSGWGRTGPRSLDDFSDVIWINSHSGERQYPF